MSSRRVVDSLLLSYAALVAFLTLQPFHFELPSVLRNRWLAAPSWTPNGGMTFHGAGAFVFPGPTPRIADAVRESGRFHLYVEMRPSASTPTPARIVSYAASARTPAFTLDQVGSDVLFRITDSHVEGAPRELRLHAELDVNEWRSVLVAVTPETLFLAAGARSEQLVSPEDLTRGWPRDAHLAIGNEVDLSAPWRGELRRLVLGTESSASLIRAAHGHSLAAAQLPGTPTSRLLDVSADRALPVGLVATRAPLSGELPRPWTLRPFVEPARRRWARTDWTINALLLMPIGALLAVRRARPLAILGTLLAISLGIELTQVFLPARHTQATDLVLNVAGGLVGGLLVERLRAHRAPDGRRAADVDRT